MDALDLEWLDEVVRDERFVIPKLIEQNRAACVRRLITGGASDDKERGAIRAYDDVMKMIEDVREEARRARDLEEKIVDDEKGS